MSATKGVFLDEVDVSTFEQINSKLQEINSNVNDIAGSFDGFLSKTSAIATILGGGVAIFEILGSLVNKRFNKELKNTVPYIRKIKNSLEGISLSAELNSNTFDSIKSELTKDEFLSSSKKSRKNYKLINHSNRKSKQLKNNVFMKGKYL